MPELTREEKLELVEKLPQRLQDFLYSEDTGAFLLYIGEKYSIPDEKIGLLSKLVGDIVLGITPITSLAQEINSKIKTDVQTAMSLAQELYSDLLSPVMSKTQTMPPPPSQISPRETLEGKPPIAPVTLPAPPATPTAPAQIPKPPVDKYREPITTGPEIVDLRKTPPAPIPVPIAPAPIPLAIKKIEPPAVPPPLIEANPHKMQEEKIAAPPMVSKVEPQFIIRPPGTALTDTPHNVLDLRKDKGEF